MRYSSGSYQTFKVFNYILLGAIAITCIIPIVHVLAVSFSGKEAAGANLVGLWPIDFTVDAYAETIDNPNFLNSLQTSFLRTILGTVLSMILTVMIAYPLSKDDIEFKGRKWYVWLFVFAMLFNGGLIPSYILISKMGLMNSIWALVLPVAINSFNLILMMNFFRTSVPKALEEAALIDGAGYFRILFQIYVPIAMPAIAAISLFTMVFHWNSWFDGLIYMSDLEKYPLATFLQTVVVQQDFSRLSVDSESLKNMSQRTVKAAQIFIGALPILLVYPFLQRFFVKGIVLGSVKE
ncbi:carbohydrate ABC transporter permease [Cohnella sp. REN36]|uniref:carbohydrate ABC transporter permease n=1 Tax=Cohnella sp. REN36 TaxID=2887347 RepID=UPI001D13E5C7|nr:carbohydrate ABC transporter permease [Cohnella sp. REN36]MCC3372078.1 carbohydrate ABC transporter permease [Cohnella sp. REN36]